MPFHGLGLWCLVEQKKNMPNNDLASIFCVLAYTSTRDKISEETPHCAQCMQFEITVDPTRQKKEEKTF